MFRMLFALFLFLGLVLGTQAGGLDLDIPSNVHNRSIIVKGELRCGSKPLAGARIRLFRTYQKNSIDDLSQLMGNGLTKDSGIFFIEGNTAKFPDTQTEVDPYVTIHHACDLDPQVVANQGYKRWAVRLPVDYVTLGIRPRKSYNFGVVNLQLEYPGEVHDKQFSINE